MFSNMFFAYPWVLYLLIIIPVLAALYWVKGRKQQSFVTYSSLGPFKSVSPSWKERLKYLPVIFRLIALILLIIALARPQSFSSGEDIYTEGIDIVMAFDISGSMLAEDLKPNRFEAAKNVIDGFVQARTSDRIGLVIFSRVAFTQCPLTVDYTVLRNLLREIKTGMLEDGTAIGNGIANSVNRLKDSKAKSKVIIIMTDGVNNAGEIDPVSSAHMAAAFGIRVYTVGCGTRGEAPYPVQTPFGTRYQMVPVEIDENVLKEIARITGGQYFRATNTKKLEEIYQEIDKLEKTKIEITSYRNAKELYFAWLGGGFIFLLLELGLSGTVLRKLP